VRGASVGVSDRVTPPKGAAIKETVAKLDGIWDPALVTNTRQPKAEVPGGVQFGEWETSGSC